MKIFVISDRDDLLCSFMNIVRFGFSGYKFYYFCTPNHKSASNSNIITPILLEEKEDDFFQHYDLFISLHCRQIFPKNLVKKYRCINIHPGLNPYNRGWYPHVFSIINKLPTGVTIHEMDEYIDHGPIIYAKQIDIIDTDTSYEVYKRILNTEIELLKTHLKDILSKNYETVTVGEGNFNSKKDFKELCKIDLNKKATYQEVIDHLRALSFKNMENAFFLDSKGNKIYVQVKLSYKSEINNE